MRRDVCFALTLLFLSTLLLIVVASCAPQCAPCPPRNELETQVAALQTEIAELSPTSTVTEPTQIEISVYFTDSNHYATGTPPFEVAVTRYVSPTSNLPKAVLTEFFRGPSDQERSQGLELITSGFTGFSSLRIENGVAHVYLTGPCESHGATYTIAQPLLANLLQSDEIDFVKIYDSGGETEQPTGQTNSIPFCPEP